MIEMLLVTKQRFKHWSCQNVSDAISYLLDNISIRFGTKLHRQIVGIPRVLVVLLAADLSLFCYEKDFMTSLSDDTQADIIEAFFFFFFFFFLIHPLFYDDSVHIS